MSKTNKTKAGSKPRFQGIPAVIAKHERIGKTAAEGRVTVHLDPELARALRLAAADRACTQSDVITEALVLLFGRKAPPGYRPSVRAELSPLEALRRARDLRAAGQTFKAVAELLNAEGYRTRQGSRWTGLNLQQRLRRGKG